MKNFLGISDFLEEISSLSHSIVFLYFAIITEEGFSSLLAILSNSAFRWVYLSFSPLPLASLLFSAKVKSLSRVRLFATPWTAAYQAPPWIFQARILEWGAIAFSVMYINPPKIRFIMDTVCKAGQPV